MYSFEVKLLETKYNMGHTDAMSCAPVSFAISTYNAAGLGDDKKRRKAGQFLSRWGGDIVLLQETHGLRDNEIFLKANLHYEEALFSHGNNRARGVAIMWKKRLNLTIDWQKTDNDGRLAGLGATIEGQKFAIYCIYASNSDNERIRNFE